MSVSPISSNNLKINEAISQQPSSSGSDIKYHHRPPVLPTELELFPELKRRVQHKKDRKNKHPELEKVLKKLFSSITPDKAEFKSPKKISRDAMRARRGRVYGKRAPVKVGTSDYHTIRATGPKTIDEDRSASGLLQIIEKSGKTHDVQYFGVFDGHGGDEVSKFLRVNMGKILASKLSKIDLNSPVEIKHALKAAFIEANARYKETGGRDAVGATTLVALVIGKNLWVANAGDGRAVLAKGKQAVQLSKDANATSEPFLSSLRKRGYDGKYLYQRAGSTGCEVSTEDPRKQGIDTSLIVSRVFIPKGGKECVIPSLMPARVVGDLELPGVSCRPKVTCFDLSTLDESENNYLIMGTDGLWDTIDTQEAVDIAHKTGLKSKSDGAKAKDIACKLLCEAFFWDSVDNTTVSVIKL